MHVLSDSTALSDVHTHSKARVLHAMHGTMYLRIKIVEELYGWFVIGHGLQALRALSHKLDFVYTRSVGPVTEQQYQT